MTNINEYTDFERGDFSGLEKKASISLNKERLQIYAPMYRYKAMGFFFLFAAFTAIAGFCYQLFIEIPTYNLSNQTTEFYLLGMMLLIEMLGVLFFCFLTIFLFFHHFYVEISANKITTRHLIFSLTYSTKTLLSEEIETLMVRKHGSETRNGTLVKEFYKIKAYPKKKGKQGKIKVKDTITIIEGIENNEALAINFANYIKNKIGMVD